MTVRPASRCWVYRLLRMDEHECPACHQAVLHRAKRFPATCWYCGAPMVDWTRLSRLAGDLATLWEETFPAMARDLMKAMEGFAAALGTTWVVEVEWSTHDDLKAGRTCVAQSRVEVIAPTEDQAELVAAQIVATGDRVPTRTTVITPGRLAAEQSERHAQAARMRR